VHYASEHKSCFKCGHMLVVKTGHVNAELVEFQSSEFEHLY
jgi:hypothetical protein